MERDIEHIQLVVGSIVSQDEIRRIYGLTKNVDQTIDMIMEGDYSYSSVVPKYKTLNKTSEQLEIIDLTQNDDDIVEIFPTSTSRITTSIDNNNNNEKQVLKEQQEPIVNERMMKKAAAANKLLLKVLFVYILMS